MEACGTLLNPGALDSYIFVYRIWSPLDALPVELTESLLARLQS